MNQRDSRTDGKRKAREDFASPQKVHRERVAISNAVVQKNANSICILVNKNRQYGNPVIKHITNVAVQYEEDIIPDYVLGAACCALYLSLRYHLLYPSYIVHRVAEIKNEYRVRILLVLVDMDDNVACLVYLNQLAIKHNFSLILAYTAKEAGRYLETFKSYEKKSATLLQERIESQHLPMVNDTLGKIPSINKTDVTTLLTSLGNLNCIINANESQLSTCPGLGPKKVKRLLHTFQASFQ